MATRSGIGRLRHATSLRAQVEQAIAAAITSGELRPGELFSVPGLAERFAVSATPVREALLNLEQRGFVEPVRNKGFRVTQVDREALTKITEVRMLLEPEALAQLAADFDASMAVEARALAERIVAGAAADDLAGYLAADRRFHLTLLGYLGNPHLTTIVADLRERTRLTGLQDLRHTDRLQTSAAEHHELVDLLEAHDADGVRDLMRRHVGHVVGWWSGEDESRTTVTAGGRDG
jgi:DNA-binding GntR family transcriptional regulator